MRSKPLPGLGAAKPDPIVLEPIDPGFRLISLEVQDLTSEVVQAYRGLPASPVERDLCRSHVKHLREKADAGRLVSFHWVTASVTARPDTILRINGQHSSVMLS